MQKWLNQLRCYLGVESCVSKEPCVRWGLDSPWKGALCKADMCRPMVTYLVLIVSALCIVPANVGKWTNAFTTARDYKTACVSCGCNVGMEQSASTDQDRLLSDNILASVQGLSFPSVIRLMEFYHCPFSRWRTKPERVFVLICQFV